MRGISHLKWMFIKLYFARMPGFQKLIAHCGGGGSSSTVSFALRLTKNACVNCTFGGNWPLSIATEADDVTTPKCQNSSTTKWRVAQTSTMVICPICIRFICLARQQARYSKTHLPSIWGQARRMYHNLEAYLLFQCRR